MKALFYQQFEDIVQQVSETKLAIIFKDQQLTYQELNKKINQLAHYLQSLQLESETCIGIFLEPSPDVVISVLAIMKAGLAFVPLSVGTDVGSSRLKDCIQDSKLKIILTHKKLRQHHVFSQLNNLAVELLDLDELRPELDQQASSNLALEIATNQLAYIIYSSGSTGNPKGILIEHKGLINCMVAHHQTMEITEADRIAQYAPLEFDASIIEIMMALGAGASLVIVPQEIRLNWSALSKYYQSDSTYVTVSILTPSILKKLKFEELNKLRIVISTGEKLEPDLFDRLIKFVKLIDGYGPSEATICTTLGICNSETGVHIGQNAIQGLELFILEPDYDFTKGSSPKPVAEGEIYIAGDGLARGYTDEKLSQQRFREIQHPLYPEKTIRVFQTRDLARKNQKNYLELLGRLDGQVKIYGKLICPEEIENLLREQQDVVDAFFDIRINSSGHPEKTVYIISQQQSQNINMIDDNNAVKEDKQEILAEQNNHIERQSVDPFFYELIKRKLTGTMLPTRWVYLKKNDEKISKILINGKLNRKALASLGVDEKKYYIREIDKQTSLDEVEEKLVMLWEEELQLKKMDADFKYQMEDNFLYLGGTSMQYANLIENIKYTFNLKLDIQTFLLNPTIASIARRIRRSINKNTVSPLIQLHLKYPLKNHSSTEATPLFLIHTLLGDPQNDYAKVFLDAWIKSSDGRPVYGIKARGLENSKDMDTSLQEIAADYLEAIQKIQSQGPYLLGGWSAGVWIIREIAAQLQASGEQVAIFGIDSTAVTVFKTMSTHDYANYLFDLEEKAIRPRVNSSPLNETDKKIIQQQQSKLKLLNEFFNRVKQHAPTKEINERLLTTQFSLLKAGLTYQPDSILLPCMTLIAATETQKLRGERLGWLEGDIVETIKSQEGDHFNIMVAPRVTNVVNELIIFCQQKEAYFKLAALKQQLKQRYSNSENSYIHRLFDSNDTVPINSSFINLAIVKEQQQRQDEKSKLTQVKAEHSEILSSHEAIFNLSQKEVTAIPNLLHMIKDKNHKVILIFSRPGGGKTTFCQYLANAWASGAEWMQQFELVFWIKLRKLTYDRYKRYEKLEFANIIDIECLDHTGLKNKIDIEILKKYLPQINPTKVLLLCDGYDELPNNSPCSDIINDLFEKDYSSIVTSRPNFINNRDFDLVLEIVGFSEENVTLFVKQRFKDEATVAENLLTYLKENPAIKSLAHTPLLLELLCATWKNKNAEMSHCPNWTELWANLIDELWRRWEIKLSNTNEYNPRIQFSSKKEKKLSKEDIEKITEFLQILAFQGLRESRILFSEEFIKKIYHEKYSKYDRDNDLLLDAITQIGILYTPDKEQGPKNYYFLHFSLQEYFAAGFLVNAMQKNILINVSSEKISAQKFFLNNKFNPYYQFVWWFLAGQLIDQEELLESFFVQLLNQPRDLDGFYEQLLVIRCLEECKYKLAETTKSKLLKNFLCWFDNFWIYCGFDSRMEDYFAQCPLFFHQKEIVSYILNLLETEKDDRNENLLAFLAGFTLPEAVIDFFWNDLIVAKRIHKCSPNIIWILFNNLLKRQNQQSKFYKLLITVFNFENQKIIETGIDNLSELMWKNSWEILEARQHLISHFTNLIVNQKFVAEALQGLVILDAENPWLFTQLFIKTIDPKIKKKCLELLSKGKSFLVKPDFILDFIRSQNDLNVNHNGEILTILGKFIIAEEHKLLLTEQLLKLTQENNQNIIFVTALALISLELLSEATLTRLIELIDNPNLKPIVLYLKNIILPVTNIIQFLALLTSANQEIREISLKVLQEQLLTEEIIFNFVQLIFNSISRYHNIANIEIIKLLLYLDKNTLLLEFEKRIIEKTRNFNSYEEIEKSVTALCYLLENSFTLSIERINQLLLADDIYIVEMTSNLLINVAFLPEEIIKTLIKLTYSDNLIVKKNAASSLCKLIPKKIIPSATIKDWLNDPLIKVMVMKALLSSLAAINPSKYQSLRVSMPGLFSDPDSKIRYAIAKWPTQVSEKEKYLELLKRETNPGIKAIILNKLSQLKYLSLEIIMMIIEAKVNLQGSKNNNLDEAYTNVCLYTPSLEMVKKLFIHLIYKINIEKYELNNADPTSHFVQYAVKFANQLSGSLASLSTQEWNDFKKLMMNNYMVMAIIVSKLVDLGIDVPNDIYDALLQVTVKENDDLNSQIRLAVIHVFYRVNFDKICYIYNFLGQNPILLENILRITNGYPMMNAIFFLENTLSYFDSYGKLHTFIFTSDSKKQFLEQIIAKKIQNNFIIEHNDMIETQESEITQNNEETSINISNSTNRYLNWQIPSDKNSPNKRKSDQISSDFETVPSNTANENDSSMEMNKSFI